MALQSLETPSALSIRLNTSRGVTHTTSSLPATPILPARPPSPERRPLLPDDSSTFLIALAGQERRVLELKEELERAETDLENLKRQWAVHETSKKKNEIRHIEQLQPISKSVSGPNSLPGIAKEHERQKPPSTNTKPLQRKVFSGSRHTRALSLLSPKPALSQRTMPPPVSIVPTGPGNIVNHTLRSEVNVGKSSAATTGPKSMSAAPYNPAASPPKDAILETGKQLVGDFREGLWTFFEDLRQATVGDEAILNSDSRNSPSVRNLCASKKQDSGRRGECTDLASALKEAKSADTKTKLDSRKLTGDAFGPSEKGDSLHMESSAESTSSSTKSNSMPQENPDPNEADDSGWDSWDSPKTKDLLPRLSTSSNISNHAAYSSTGKSSPRTSTRFTYLEVFAHQ